VPEMAGSAVFTGGLMVTGGGVGWWPRPNSFGMLILNPDIARFPCALCTPPQGCLQALSPAVCYGPPVVGLCPLRLREGRELGKKLWGNFLPGTIIRAAAQGEEAALQTGNSRGVAGGQQVFAQFGLVGA
jgi:hypothetical protein